MRSFRSISSAAIAASLLALALAGCGNGGGGNASAAPTAKVTSPAVSTNTGVPGHSGAVCTLVSQSAVASLMKRPVLDVTDQDILGTMDHNPDYCEYDLTADPHFIEIYRIPENTMDQSWADQKKAPYTTTVSGLGGVDAFVTNDPRYPGEFYEVRQHVGMVILVESPIVLPRSDFESLVRYAVSHL